MVPPMRKRKFKKTLHIRQGGLNRKCGERRFPSRNAQQNREHSEYHMAKLFAQTVVASALATARDTIEVGLNDDGVTVVRFALARGKGTGAQEVPVTDFPAVIDALAGYADNGINKSAKIFSPVDMLHATITMNEEDRVTFRVGSGKGAKPTNLAPTELAGVVAFLRETLPAIQKAAKGLK
jgi:hypothetical protein